MKGSPFYTSGLKFSCKKCSSCCRYENGFVYLSEKDLKKLAAKLKMEPSGFIKTYCRWVAGWKEAEVLSLKEKSTKDCIFWDSGCSVYDARPLQCRTFPFWKDIVASRSAWKTAAGGCPGMDSGKLYDENEIVKILEMRIEEPLITKQGSIYK